MPDIPPALRDDLLMDLEADDDLRAKLGIALLEPPR